MRRYALIGIGVAVLTTLGLWYLGSAEAQIDTPGRTPDKERSTYRSEDEDLRVDPDEPFDGGDRPGAGGGNGGGGGTGGGTGRVAPPPPA